MSAGRPRAYPGSSSMRNRPEWNEQPLRNPPANLRGLKPKTKEPWSAVARADMDVRMDFGSRSDLGYGELQAYNGLVEEAKRKREENERAKSWNIQPVKHQPPVLRGQKTVRRSEPWSAYHNDDIEELNAVEGVSINELYAVTADRDNRIKPTIVQPEWDASKKLGRRSYKPGDGESMRAKEFRDARKAGAWAASPTGMDASEPLW